MNKTIFILCLLIPVLACAFFASAYAFAYTPVFLLILTAGLFTLLASVNKNKYTGTWQLAWHDNPLLPLFLVFIAYLLLQIIPMPGSLITELSVVSKVVGGKSLPASATPSEIQNYWFTLAPYVYPVRMSLVRWLVYGIFFWVFLSALDSRKRIVTAVITILLIGCLEALYGILQTYSGHEHIWWYKKNAHSGFPSGTYANRNHFAGLLEMGIILAVAYAVILYQRHIKRQEGRKSLRKSFGAVFLNVFGGDQLYTKIFLVVFSGVIMGVGLVLSASRGGLISLALALLVMSLFFLFTKTYRRQGLCILIPFLLLTAVYSVIAGIDITVDRFRLFDSDFLNRAVLAEKTLEAFDDYRIFGAGIGNFQYFYPKFQDITHTGVFINYAHNDWAQLLAEGGIAGFILLLGGMGYYLFQVMKKWKKARNAMAVCLGIVPVIALISLGVHSFSDFNLHMPANMILLIALMAIGYRSFAVGKEERAALVPLPLKGKGILIIASIIIMILWSGSWVVRHFISEAYCNTIQTPPLHLNQQPDVASAEKAVQWDSGNAQYRFKLATALIGERGIIEASPDAALREKSQRIINIITDAIRLNPFKAEYHVRLGWEYSYLWYEKDYYDKWLKAADLTMERASYFNGSGAENPHLHIDLGKFWTMRAKALSPNPERQDVAWTKARWHFKKALELKGSKSVRDEITEYVKMFYQEERYIKEALE